MNAAWWLIAPLALLVVWWLAGRPGWPKARRHDADTQVSVSAGPRTEAGVARSTQAHAADEELGSRDFAPTTVMPQSEEDIRREQLEELAARRAAERAEQQAGERAAAEQEAALRAADRAAEDAQARRLAEREAAEAQERQRAADEHARNELLRQQERAETAERARLDAEAARLAAAALPSRLPEQTLVMIVDDSKVVRVKTSRLLARHQYSVALAEDGEQALLQLAGELPQVLITDVEMPGIDGIELTRRVRANALTANLPVIMITSADERLRGVADEVGVSVLLGKPYADETLIASIEKLAGIAPAARLSAA